MTKRARSGEHTHTWIEANFTIGCTVPVREAGPVTDPSCNVRATVVCEALADERFNECCEARCARHAPKAR